MGSAEVEVRWWKMRLELCSLCVVVSIERDLVGGLGLGVVVVFRG